MEEMWKDIMEMLPPLILLFFLAFSPGIMRFFQKRMAKKEGPRKPVEDIPETVSQEEPELFVHDNSVPDRVVSDYREERPPVTPAKAIEMVNRLPPLKRAVVWSEILSPPGGKTSE